MERLTRPFRYPNNVPVILEPAIIRLLLSGKRPPGREGSLHAGVIIGNDRKTLRKTRKTLVRFFFLVELTGSRRDDGGVVVVVGAGIEEEDDDDTLVLGVDDGCGCGGSA